MPKQPITVEAIVFNEEGRILLVKQGKRRAGQWELPGGHVKKDESIFAAVKREVREETGMLVDPLNVFRVFYIEDEDVHDFIICCCLGALGQPAMSNTSEIVEATWAMTKFLPTPMAEFTADLIADAAQCATYVRLFTIRSKDWVGG